MMTVEKANDYIRKKSSDVISEYRQGIHLAAPIGWMNDPNGFVYYKGEYHLFYQFYPYDSVWGPMHWGHAKSKDLIHWEDLPVALAPTEEYELDGCFSGSAIVKDGKLCLLYTGHYDREGVRREVQCLATSTDGIHFDKHPDNPLIDERQLGNYGDSQDFRDPKVLERDGLYYTVLATKTPNELGRILMFKSEDLLTWDFYSVVLEGEAHQGIMWECPDLFHLDGKDVLIMSPIEMKQEGHAYANLSSTVAFIGEMDWETGKLSVENYHEIDGGLDFYAPQTCENEQGERIMVAWMQMWQRNFPTHDLGHGWAGSMTLPRKLHVVDNYLCQEPVRGLEESLIPVLDEKAITFKEDERKVYQKVLSTQAVITVSTKLSEGDCFEIGLLETSTDHFNITVDGTSNSIVASRANIGHSIKGLEESHLTERQVVMPLCQKQLTLTMVIDTSSIELFINQEQTMSFTLFPTERGKDFSIKSTGRMSLESLIISEVR